MGALSWWNPLRRQSPPVEVVVATEVDLPGIGQTRIAQSVDCRGAMCPRPQLLTMKMMGKMNEDDVLEIRCDSAPAVEGFPALAASLQCTHLCTLREAHGWRVYLRKGA